MANYGAELFLDISRFWASKCEWNASKNKYFIKGVMGPDEYHEQGEESPEGGTRNNSYTNIMVCWVLVQSFKIMELLKPEELAEVKKKLQLE